MAGRIPQSFIDTLLDRTDVVEVVDKRIKLKKTGKNYSARCPFHDEKTPSFSVNPDKQFYYCFGCGAGGNAIGFVMDYDNIDFVQAVENLALSAGLFVSQKNTGFSANALTHKMLKLYRDAGFDGASSHSGRRSFATNCIRAGVDIVSLKTLMNHSNIQQTSEYVATNEEALLKAVMAV